MRKTAFTLDRFSSRHRPLSRACTFFLIYIFTWSLWHPIPVGAQEPQSPQVSIKDIVEQLRERQTQIKNFKGVYVGDTRTNILNAGVRSLGSEITEIYSGSNRHITTNGDAFAGEPQPGKDLAIVKRTTVEVFHDHKRKIYDAIEMQGNILREDKNVKSLITELWLQKQGTDIADCILMENASLIPPKKIRADWCIGVKVPAFNQKREVRPEKAIRFWFSTAHELFPVRIESGKFTDTGEFVPTLQIDTTEIGHTPDGILYPSKAVRVFSLYPEPGSVQRSTLELTCKEFQANIDLPDNLFKYKFPDGTAVANMITNEFYVVGEETN